MWDYKGRLGLHQEYNPTMIGLYALSMYNLYSKTSKKTYSDEFFRHADFLVKTLSENRNFGVWLVKFHWIAPCYLCIPPWTSGLSQGLGLSMMTRAWILSGDKKYLNAAQKALLSFEVPVSKGGVLTVDKNGFWWYDEYACTKSANVLNGLLFALIGIYEFYDSIRDSKALFLFNKGLETTKNYLKKFDLNGFIFKWSRYDDKLFIYSGSKYHHWHVKQLMELYKFTGDETLLRWAKKWLRYEQVYKPMVSNLLFNYPWYMFVAILKKLFTFCYNKNF